jgi:hypothetical protein
MFGIEYSTQRFGLLQIISRGRFCMVLSGRRQIHIQSGPLFKAQIMVKMETDTIRVGLVSRQLANNAAASRSATGWALLSRQLANNAAASHSASGWA